MISNILHYNHDFKYLAKLSQKVKNSSLLPILNPEEIFTLIGRFDYFITSSLHGAIFTYVHNIPFIVLDVEKTRFFMEDRGLDRYLFKDVSELKSAFERLQNNPPDYAGSLDGDLKILKEHQDTIRDILCTNYVAMPEKIKQGEIKPRADELLDKLQEVYYQIHHLHIQIIQIQRELAEKEKKDTHIVNLEQSIKEKDSHITNLNLDIQSMRETIGWQMLEKFRRIRDKIIPPTTRRRLWLYDYPKKFVKSVRLYGIKFAVKKAINKIKEGEKYPQFHATGRNLLSMFGRKPIIINTLPESQIDAAALYAIESIDQPIDKINNPFLQQNIISENQLPDVIKAYLFRIFEATEKTFRNKQIFPKSHVEVDINLLKNDFLSLLFLYHPNTNIRLPGEASRN